MGLVDMGKYEWVRLGHHVNSKVGRGRMVRYSRIQVWSLDPTLWVGFWEGGQFWTPGCDTGGVSGGST